MIKPFPNKKYQIIYADPPWRYNDKLNSKSAKMGACEHHYSTLSIKEISDLPVKELADKDCVLFLWVTMPKLNECFNVITAWGFTYKTCAFTWIKTNPKAGTIFKGIGRWVMGNAELCLLATKGHPHRINKNISQIVISKRRQHSRKPDIIRNKIIKLIGNKPKIELFARQRTEGWDVWGNEIPKETQKTITNPQTYITD